MRARRPEIFPARSASTCWTNSRSARSVEFETLGAHECAEIGPLRHRILPGLVLRPAIDRALAEFIGVALGLVGLHRFAPSIVGRDPVLERTLVVAVMV